MGEVKVIYCAQDGPQAIISVAVVDKIRACDAIEQSGILEKFPEIDLTRNAIGTYGRIIDGDTVVCAGERIEIYRPLKQSPLEQRHTRLKEES